MTISSTEPLVAGPYNGNDVTTVFDYDMSIFAETELLVFIRDSLGVETLQTLNTDYTVTPTGGDFPATGGIVTMAVAPATGEELIILPDITRSQDRPFSSQSSITLQEVEDALDKLTAITRQLYERSLRAVTVSAFDPGDVDTLIANVTALVALETEIIAISANLAAIQNVDANMASVVGAAAEAAAAAASAAAALVSEAAAAASEAAAAASEAAAAASVSSLAFTPVGLAIGRSVGDDTITPGANSQGSVSIPASTTFVFSDSIAATSGLTMPATVASQNGYPVTVVANPSSTARLNVYPASGEAFAGLANDVPVSLAPGYVLNCWQRLNSPGRWGYSISSPDNEEMFFRLAADNVGVNGTGVQDMFDVGAVLEADATYEYKIVARIGKTAGTTSHNFSTGFGGTATFVAGEGRRSVKYRQSSSTDTTSILLSANAMSLTALINSLTSASVTLAIEEDGLFRCDGAGTLIPQYQLSAAPGGAYTVSEGSWMRVKKLLSADSDRKGLWV